MSWAALDPERRELAEELLTPKQLEVFRYWLDGHSNATIARALDLDESAVRRRLARALRRIGPHLNRDAA